MSYYKYRLPHGYYISTVKDLGYAVVNAVRVKPEIIPGFWPRWPVEKPDAKEWEQAEDHRGKQGYLDGKPHTITEYGKLPKGWSTEAPDPTPEEQDAEARAHVLAELAALDAAYLTPRVLAGLAVGDEYAAEQYRTHEEAAAPWRQRLAAIPDPAAE